MIQGKQLVQDALNAHQFDPLSTILLGDILLGTALTAATLKGQQRVQFSFQKTVEGSVNWSPRPMLPARFEVIAPA